VAYPLTKKIPLLDERRGITGEEKYSRGKRQSPLLV
jgi:hypothetical protein